MRRPRTRPRPEELAASGAGPEREELEIGGRRVSLPHPDKLLYLATGFTRRDALRYYLAVAPALLPHLAGRAVTLARFPDGVDAAGWYQVNCPPGAPEWMAPWSLRTSAGEPLRPCRIEEPAALAWAVGRGALELHPVRARPGDPGTADLVLDLDPTAPAHLLEVAEAALDARALLARRGLVAEVKASGGGGVHVLARLEAPLPFAEVVALARDIAAELAAAAPARIADRIPRAGREGKVLVDWRQNEPGRSLIAPWSLRAAAVPVVAAPLTWAEVEAAVGAREPARLRIGPDEALSRAGIHDA